ncbi:MAG: mechanosensitive ion channel family protein [Alphaproteobacteria bacterium]|nr:MAG: mechanosensitive ion channel family protein [Alphaproteobacteria bacterium]
MSAGRGARWGWLGALALGLALALGAAAPAQEGTGAGTAASTDTSTTAPAPTPAPAAAPAAAASEEAAPPPPPAGPRVDMAAWEDLASRAESVLASGEASNEALAELRGQLVAMRDQLKAQRDAAVARAEPIRKQLEALGPPPAEGESEPVEVATQRAELTRRLKEAEAPARTAEAALQRAEGLIGQIDRLVAERRARALLARGPVPVDPTLWWPAAAALTEVVSRAVQEALSPLGSEIRRREVLDALPAVMVLLVVALVLLVVGRRWLRRFTPLGRLAARPPSGAAPMAARALLRAGDLALPALGVIAAAQAVALSGILELRSAALVTALRDGALLLVAGLWLARELTGGEIAATVLPGAEPAERAAVRRALSLLAGAAALWALLARIDVLGEIGAEHMAVLRFPLLLLGGVGLARLGQLLLRVSRRAVHARASGGEEEEAEEGAPAEGSPRLTVLRLLGLASLLLGVAAPLAALAGYGNLASAAELPAIRSLGVLGAAVVIHRELLDLYAFLARLGGGAAEAEAGRLTGALLALALALGVVPLLALVWGASPEDLAAAWRALIEGVRIGETTISFGAFVTFAVIFVVGYTLTRVVQGVLRGSILPSTRLDRGAQSALVTGTGYVGIFLSALAAITAAGIDLSSLAIVAGALSVGIGFGLQAIVSNFVSGIILLIERPIKEGDWVEVGGVSGYVKKISVRATQIETFDRATVVLPNSELIAGTVTNWTLGSPVGRMKVPVGVAYGSDTEKVRDILLEIARAHPRILRRPEPKVVFLGFGADSLNFELRAYLRDINYVLSTTSDINFEIDRRFREAGIEIPFAQRDIHLRDIDRLEDAIRNAGRGPRRGSGGAGPAEGEAG